MPITLHPLQTAQFVHFRSRLVEADACVKILMASLDELRRGSEEVGLDKHVGAAIGRLRSAQLSKPFVLRQAQSTLAMAERRLLMLLLIDAVSSFETYVTDLIYLHLLVKPRKWTATWTDSKGKPKTTSDSKHSHAWFARPHEKGERLPCCYESARVWARNVSAVHRHHAFESTLGSLPTLSSVLPQSIMEYARLVRNAVAHEDGVASAELAGLASKDLESEAKKLSRRGRIPPILPHFDAGMPVSLDPEHVILLLTTLRAAAKEYDSVFLGTLGPHETLSYVAWTFCAYPNCIRRTNHIERDLGAISRRILGDKKVCDQDIAGLLRKHPSRELIREQHRLCDPVVRGPRSRRNRGPRTVAC